VAKRSLYDILGLSRRASAQDIKTAFRKHARDHHPDVVGNDKAAEERFKDISRAYAILGNENERKRYDRGEIDESGASTVAPGRRPGSGPSRSTSSSGAGAGAGSARSTVKIKGANVSYTLRVGTREAGNGAKKTISTTSGRRLNVTIPPGTRSGQVLRLKGQGLPGIGGGGDGDALIEILIDRRDAFRTEGDDVHVDLPISLKEAVLGARLPAPCLDGEVTLTVPPNSNTGDVLRLRGKGLERSDGGRGDQYVRLLVTLPSKGDAALTAFVRDWSPSEDVRAGKRKAETDG